MIEIRVEGAEELKASLKRLGILYPKAAAGAIYKLGVAIISNALPRVPVEFGVLRASHYVAPPLPSEKDPIVELGFGTVYAVPQHERLDYRHPRGGEAKYLQKAVDVLAPQALNLLAKWTRDLAAHGSSWGTTGMPTRPITSNSNRKSRSQSNRLARAARNVRKRTSR